MKAYRSILTVIAIVAGMVWAQAENIVVNVTPVQPILPPQIGMYMENLGQFIRISMSNTGQTAENVYLAITLDQVQPDEGVHVATPTKRLPKVPFTVPAGGNLILTQPQINNLFDHFPLSEVQMSDGLMGNFMSGGFGLLPEGLYKISITAYKWDPTLSTPQPVSNPNLGYTNFRICYKANAPQFTTPAGVGNVNELNVSTLDPQNPLFTWTTPIIACSPRSVSYTYDFRVVELAANRSVDEVLTYGANVLQRTGLTVPQFRVPQQLLSELKEGKTYVAQVTATTSLGTQGNMNYVMVENNGKSTPIVFRLKEQQPIVVPTPEKKDDDKKEEEKKEKKEGVLELDSVNAYYDHIQSDKRYVLQSPKLISPEFSGNRNRALFVGDSVKAEWERPEQLGGTGEKPDTLKFKYTAELYTISGYSDVEAALEAGPFLTHNDIGIDELYNIFPWEELDGKVSMAEVLMLRIVPECKNDTSVSFSNDTINTCLFQYSDKLSEAFGECDENGMIKENRKPYDISEKDMRGKLVHIGHYMLQMGDDVTFDKKSKSWSGTGFIEWKPLGFKTMVGVKFEKIFINSDLVVYEGQVLSEARANGDKIKGKEIIPDDIFTEWGIDNLIGYKTPEALKSKVNDLAKKVKANKYYDYVSKGYAIYDKFLNGELNQVYLPLQLPKSMNPSPIDIQIISMEFNPTRAWMNLMGVFTLPETDILEDNILMFGAPRICMNPERVLPGTGTVCLLSDITLNDPKSDFQFTFKAPSDIKDPKDGCLISWQDDKLGELSFEADMKIPGLRKDVDGDMGDELPKVYLKATVSDWEDWTATVAMDKFQVEDMPGWSFSPGSITYDHSKKKKADKMVSLPEDYDKTKAGMVKNDAVEKWEGLYINGMSIQFPKALSFSGISGFGKGRLEIEAKEMFFDQSGASVAFQSAGTILSLETGKLGGWSISIDKLTLDIVQNTFKSVGFNGKFSVPILKGDIGYQCSMASQGVDKEGQTKDFAYTFKTQQIGDLSLDFILGKADFEKNQTFFEVSSKDRGKGTNETRVELVAGGTVTIAGQKKLQSALPFNFELPKIKFVNMRVANFSMNESESVKKIKANFSLLDFTDAMKIKKEYSFKSSDGKMEVFYSFGEWGLSSPSKKLGPFTFTLDKYGIENSGSLLGLKVGGSVSLLDGLVTAGTTLTIWGKVDLKNFSASYNSTDFNEISLGCNVHGIKLNGTLTIDKKSTTKKGYGGKIDFALPGDLITCKASGGWYENKDDPDNGFSWGYFVAETSSAVGLPIPPVQINGISGGFYFNCYAQFTKLDDPTPQKGMIGGMFGMKVSTIGDENMLKAEGKLTVFYDSKNKRLASMILNGKMNGLSIAGGKGLINGECTVEYVSEKDDKHLEISVTIDASADATQLVNDFVEKMTGVQLKMQGITGGLTDMDADHSEKPAEGGKTEESVKNASNSQKDSDKAFSCKAGVSVSINFKVSMKPDGYKGNYNTKWHLYLGQPDWDKRCKVVLIDFQIGKKTDAIACWAYLAFNAYLCIGNELPNDGALPEIPAKVKEFLDGPKIDNSGSLSSKAKSKQQESKKELERLSDPKNAVTGGRGGIMFGAGAEGDFGINAGIVYAHGSFAIGFDLILKKLGSGSSCIGGKKAGYKGWYAMGQVYAMLQGDLGVKINLFFIKKDVSLIDVGLGALLQGGLPNPTWVYGKVRAKCSLLGGLIKFNHAIEFKAGDVCIPDYGNPLDDIKMFANADPGVEDKDKGWGSAEAVSTFAELTFNTNYRMCTDANDKSQLIELVDENKAVEMAEKRGLSLEAARNMHVRTYRFVMDKRELKQYEKKGSSYTLKATMNLGLKNSSNKQNWTLQMGVLEPYAYYQLHLEAHAEEQRNKVWGRPWYNDEKSNWKDEQRDAKESKDFYFHVGNYPANVEDNIAVSYPHAQKKFMEMSYSTGTYEPYYKDYNAWAYDTQYPIISFKGIPPYDTSTYDYYWIQETGAKNDKKEVQRIRNQVIEVKESGYTKYLIWKPQYGFSKPLSTSSMAAQYITLARINKKKYQDYLDKMRQSEAVKMTTHDKARKSANQKTASQKNYTVDGYSTVSNEPTLDLGAEMNKFLETEDNEMKNDATTQRDENLRKYRVAKADYYEEIWSAYIPYVVSGSMANSSSYYMMSCDRTYGALSDITHKNNMGSCPNVKDEDVADNAYFLRSPWLYATYWAYYGMPAKITTRKNGMNDLSYTMQGINFTFWSQGTERKNSYLTGENTGYNNSVFARDCNFWPKPWHSTQYGNYTNNDFYLNIAMDVRSMDQKPSPTTYSNWENMNFAYTPIFKAVMLDLYSDAMTMEKLSTLLYFSNSNNTASNKDCVNTLLDVGQVSKTCGKESQFKSQSKYNIGQWSGTNYTFPGGYYCNKRIGGWQTSIGQRTMRSEFWWKYGEFTFPKLQNYFMGWLNNEPYRRKPSNHDRPLYGSWEIYNNLRSERSPYAKDDYKVTNNKAYKVYQYAGWESKRFYALDYLRSITSVKFVIYRANRYNRRTGIYDIYPGTESNNVRYITLNNPFSYYF